MMYIFISLLIYVEDFGWVRTLVILYSKVEDIGWVNYFLQETYVTYPTWAVIKTVVKFPWKYWLVRGDPYIMAYWNPYITG